MSNPHWGCPFARKVRGGLIQFFYTIVGCLEDKLY
uniref:Uncharacterized protein n=1 Tax=Siphoviridae sp. cttaA39 TaxID=2827960 RepID=A0A8S5TMU7_9CAUD|nr:MAG TPA: hypothetical protein [Siphoviridae sp. cttaA39]